MRRETAALKYYPLAVRLRGRRVIVAGGGRVAERKVNALRRCAAKVVVISPTATPALRRLAGRGRIAWVRRRLRRNDISGAYLIVAATNDNDINEKVSRWARLCRVWVNVVDRTALCDFISPAVFGSGGAVITVYTDGRDPALSRDLKNFLKERWNDFLSYRNRLQVHPS